MKNGLDVLYGRTAVHQCALCNFSTMYYLLVDWLGGWAVGRPFASHLQPSKGLAWIGIKQQLLVTPSAQLGAWLFFMSSIITRKAESLNIVQFHGCRA